MKKYLSAGAALMLTTTAAFAGGIDRSGQSIAVLFEEGTYAEISFGSAAPEITGHMIGVTAAETGDIAPDYTTFGLAFKMDVNDQVSLAFISDEPFGADVSYDAATYPLVGAGAEVNTRALTILGQYQINENMSVYAGPRIVSADGQYRGPTALGGYVSNYDKGTDVGYVIGAAYEIPEIALRGSLTYSSQTEFALDGDGAGGLGDLSATMPQSVNLEFQTGIAADTLAMVSVRWADWSEATIDDAVAGNLTDFGNADTMTYSVGIGRRFTDNFSGLVSVGYEKATGDTTGQLSPTDGYLSLSLGGAYTLDNGMEISGGVRYVNIGDADSDAIAAAGFPGGRFEDNHAIGYGLKLAYNY